MSDMILAVRITADGAQLVGQLSAAETKAAELKGAMSGAAAGTKELSSAADGAARATTAAAAGARALAEAEKEQTRAAREAATEQKRHEQAVTSALARQRQGYQQVGFQAQDFFTQIGSGTSVTQAFVQQSGQMVGALQLIAAESNGTKGKMAAFASFLGGPWGIALGVAIPIIGVLASKLFETGEASKEAEDASDRLAKRVADLGTFFDLTTGKVRATNSALREYAILSRGEQLNEIRARNRARVTEINQEVASAGQISVRYGGTAGNETGRAQIVRGGNPIEEAIRRANGNQAQIDAELRRLAQGQGETAARANRILTLRGQAADDQIAISQLTGEARAIETGRADPSLLNLRTNRGQRGPSAEVLARRAAAEDERRANKARQLAEFGDRAAESIARINDRWNEQPQLIDRARQDTAALDALIADLQTKKPLNFEAAIASATEAKSAIESGLLKPFNDLVKSHDRQRELQLLVLQGREDEAEVLTRVRRLQDQGVNVTAEQRAEIERMVAAEQQINDLLDKRDAIIGAYQQSLGSLRSDLEDLFSGGSIGDFAKNLTANVRRLRGQLLTEQLFGDGFRQLERQMRQATGLEGAVEQLDTQVRDTSTSLDTVATAADRLANSLTGTAGRIGGDGAGSFDLGGMLDSQIRDFFTGYRPQGLNSDADMNGDVDGGTLPVVAPGRSVTRPTINSMRPNDYFAGVARVLAAPIVGMLERLDDTLGTKLSGKLGGVIEGGIQGYMRAGPVGAALGAIRSIEGLPAGISKALGKGLQGAETGTQIAGIGKALGLKMSTTGSQIGGAVGAALPIPGGEIIGSVVGGLLGGLFKKVPKASATITNTTSDVVASGNKAGARAAVSDLGSGIQSTLASIAEQLGGTLGNFAVTVGQYKENFRVSGDAGADVTSKKAKGLLYDGKDASEAGRIAVLNAIADGAVGGVSAAVQRALASSSDLERGLKEALKVQQVEEIIGGLGASLEKQFRTFEAQAKDRVRIATEYGFDVVKIEERNAEDRKKLVDQLLADRVGSLQQLLQDFKFGDLFEGSAADRRKALLAEVAKAKADAEAGIDGAAQRLADLTRQLVETSRDAYGTAGGEFATDRANAISAAERVIQLENERIKAAQDAAVGTKAAVDKNNELTNESNDLLAQIVAALTGMGGGLGLSEEQYRAALVASRAGVDRQVAL